MEIEVRQGEDWYYLRTALPGVAGKALQAAGVAHPATRFGQYQKMWCQRINPPIQLFDIADFYKYDC